MTTLPTAVMQLLSGMVQNVLLVMIQLQSSISLPQNVKSVLKEPSTTQQQTFLFSIQTHTDVSHISQLPPTFQFIHQDWSWIQTPPMLIGTIMLRKIKTSLSVLSQIHSGTEPNVFHAQNFSTLSLKNVKLVNLDLPFILILTNVNQLNHFNLHLKTCSMQSFDLYSVHLFYFFLINFYFISQIIKFISI